MDCLEQNTCGQCTEAASKYCNYFDDYFCSTECHEIAHIREDDAVSTEDTN